MSTEEYPLRHAASRGVSLASPTDCIRAGSSRYRFSGDGSPLVLHFQRPAASSVGNPMDDQCDVDGVGARR